MKEKNGRHSMLAICGRMRCDTFGCYANFSNNTAVLMFKYKSIKIKPITSE